VASPGPALAALRWPPARGGRAGHPKEREHRGGGCCPHLWSRPGCARPWPGQPWPGGQGTRGAAPEAAPPTEAADVAAQGGKRKEKRGAVAPPLTAHGLAQPGRGLPSLAALARPGEPSEAAPAAMAGAGLGVAAGHPKNERGKRGDVGFGVEEIYGGGGDDDLGC